MRMWNGYRRVILIEYDMTTDFAADYYQGGDITKFTGRLAIEMIASEEGDPCEPESGGGGGLWESDVYDGVRDPGSGINGKQELIAAQFAVLGMMLEAAQNGDNDGMSHGGVPFNHTTSGRKLAFDLSDATGPCDEDEVGILDPEDDKHKEDCATLTKLRNTAGIMTSLVTLRGLMDQDGEKLFSFRKTSSGNTIATPQINSTGQTAELFRTTTTYGVAHIHQKGLQNDPSELYEMFSFADLKAPYLFAKDYESPPSPGAPHPIPLFFNMMVVEGYVYAVFPNDPDAFTGLGAIFENKREVKKLDLELNNLYSAFAAYNQASQKSLAEIFLNFINNSAKNSAKVNFNMSLYRISNAPGSNGKWEKLELNPVTNQLKPAIPCP